MLDQTVDLFLIFWGNFILFLIKVQPIYIPITSVKAFTFIHILTNTFLFLVVGFLTLICISLIISDIDTDNW